MSRTEAPAGISARRVPMRVIVHGLHRTGTTSMRTALHQLGFHECYHMESVVCNLQTHPDMWTAAIEAKYAGKGNPWSRHDWDKILGNAQACVDCPTALFTIELAEAYPEAKVVILNRDPEKWYQSACETIYKNALPLSTPDKIKNWYIAALDGQHRSWIRFLRAMFKHLQLYDHPRNKGKAIEWFNMQYQDVRDAVPAERCLEFSVKDGWRPLCDHLGVAVPMVADEMTGNVAEAPFPHVNDREAFNKRSGSVREERLWGAHVKLLLMICYAANVVILVYGGYFMWNNWRRGRLGCERSMVYQGAGTFGYP